MLKKNEVLWLSLLAVILVAAFLAVTQQVTARVPARAPTVAPFPTQIAHAGASPLAQATAVADTRQAPDATDGSGNDSPASAQATALPVLTLEDALLDALKAPSDVNRLYRWVSEHGQPEANEFAYAAAGSTPEVTPEVTAEPCPAFPYTVPAGNTAALIYAIECANTNGAGTNDVINLTNSTYTLTEIHYSGSDSGLPAIVAVGTAGKLTINGNGATIERSNAGVTPQFILLRLKPLSNLTLNEVTLRNGNRAIINGGSLTLSNSTISGNTASLGGGIYVSSTGFATISNVTFTGNTATASGGGLYVISGTVTLTNTTFSDNSSGSGAGSGVYVYSGSVYIYNSIIANGTGTTDCTKNSGSMLVAYSLIEDGSCGISVGTNGNRTGDPNLGTLTGSPAYYPLNASSIAINGGNNTQLSESNLLVDYNGDGDTSDIIGTDQRGIGFARVIGSKVDMGAIESGTGPEATPEVTPEVTPEITPEVTPEITPEVTEEPCLIFPYTVPAGDTAALIAAIACANSNGTDDVINLTNSPYTLTAINNTAAVGANGLPVIEDAATAGTLTINGNGATIMRSGAGGTPEFRFLQIVGGGSLTLNNLSLYGGKTSGAGGAVFVHPNASLTLNNVRIASSYASGLASTGGGIENGGILTITNSVMSSNGAMGGAAIDNTGTLVVTNSIIYSNSADKEGGAINNHGGAVYIVNTTLAMNEANGYASVDGGGALNSDGAAASVVIINSTIFKNRALGQATRGGLLVENGSVTIHNSIVADNGTGGDCTRTGGSVTASHSLIRSGGCDITYGTDGNLTGVDPQLLALIGSQGAHPYYPLRTTSPAVDAGDGMLAVDQNGTLLSTDQRGAGFPRVIGSAVDMGAIETAPAVPPTISDIANQVTDEDTPTGAIAFTVGDVGTPIEALIVKAVSSNTSRVPNENIVLNGVGANRTMTITPRTNKFGNATITVTVSDGELTASDSFVLTINPVTDVPTITDIPDLSGPLDETIYFSFKVNQPDFNVNELTVTGTSSNQALVPDANVVIQGDNADPAVQLTPLTGQTGSTLITLTVRDPNGAEAVDTFTFTVGADTLLRDGFESGGFGAWSSSSTGGGDLSITTNAALMGSLGLQAVINDTSPLYLTDESPYREKHYRARFLFELNGLSMANGDEFQILRLYGAPSTHLLQVQVQRYFGDYQIRILVYEYGSPWVSTPYVTITDAPHMLELDWQGASSSGVNDGSLSWWLDGVPQPGRNNIDNYGASIDMVRFGAMGLAANTSGTLYLDAFVSRRDSYIGWLVDAPTLVSPGSGSIIPREPAPSLTWNAVTGASEYYVEFGNGASVNVNSGWISGTSWSPGAQPQGVYTWRVKAREAGLEESQWSASSNLTIRPGAPTDVQGTALSETQISLTWTASIDAPDGITGYRVFRDGVSLGTVDDATTTYTDNGVVACATYRYKVRALRGGVGSLDSNTVTVNTPCDPIFSDGFESGSFSAWSSVVDDGGDLAVVPEASLTANSYGMRAQIDDATPLYVQDNTPLAETHYRASFRFDPNGVTMANNDRFVLLYGVQGSSTGVVRVEMRRSGSNYQVRAGIRDDAAACMYTAYFVVSDEPHTLEIAWGAASADGANDGSLAFWIDETLKQTINGIDNDTRRVDRARLGAVMELDAGTSGAVYFDAFASRRSSYIGPSVSGLSVTIEMEPTDTATREPAQTPTLTPTIEPTPEATDEPTAQVTPEPTAEVTPAATDAPTVEPTAAPTETPVPQPTLLPFSVPVFQTMDDGAPLWSASAGWTLNADAAFSGLGWQAAASGSTETLTLTVPVNLAGTSAPTLSFQSKLVSASLPEVQVSTDGAAWQTVTSVTPSLNWSLISVDLSAYAGQTVRVQFLWTTPTGTGETWQVDEVTLTEGIAQPPIEPTLPPVLPTFEIEPTATPGAPDVEPPVYLPTTVPREGGAVPGAPADLPPG